MRLNKKGEVIVYNPNGANRFTGDPREKLCWGYYIKSIVHGKGNAYASAVKAGYSIGTAKNITLTDWFIKRRESLKRKGLFIKSEEVLDKTLSLNTEKDGETNVPLLRVQTDVAKFITSTQGKDKGYSTKTDDAISKIVDREQSPEHVMKGKLFEEWLKQQSNKI